MYFPRRNSDPEKFLQSDLNEKTILLEEIVDISNFSQEIQNPRQQSVLEILAIEKKSSSIKWIIAETSTHLCESLWEYFYDIPEVKIIAAPLGDINDQEFDCLVIPGNCFGLKDPTKMWKDIEEYDSLSKK